MTLTLFELRPEYDCLAELGLEEAETVSEEDARALELQLESIQDERVTKVLALAKVVLSLEAEATTLEQQAGRLMGRARSRQRRANLLRKWMKLGLEAVSLNRVRDPFVTVWLHTSPPSVDVLDERLVPPEYQRAVLRLPYLFVPPGLRGYLQHLDVDKLAILARAKETGEVPAGVAVRTGEKHLRIS